MKNKEAYGEVLGIAGSSPDITDRIGLEQALRLSEQRYRLALRGSPVVVWECDTDLRFTFVDNLQPPVTDPAQIIGKRDDEILPFDSVRELIEIKKRVLATGAGERGELSIPAANEIFYFEVVVEPIYNSDRTIAGLRGLAIDISERKRTEETLRSVSAELRQTVHVATIGLTHCSRDLRYLSANPAYAQYIGLPLEQIVGRPIVEVMGKAAFEIIRPRIERVLLGEAVEYEDEVPIAGLHKWVRVAYTPDRDASGNVVGWVAAIMDITERKRTEEALQRSERRLCDALRVGRMGYLDWNLVTNEIQWSPETYWLFGHEPGAFSPTIEATVGMVPAEDRAFVEERLDAVIRGTAAYDIVHRMVRADGQVIYVHAQGEVMRDKQGRPLRMLGTVVDITERKQAEEVARRQADLLQLSFDAIIVWRLDGGIESWNRGAETLYGFTESEAIGHNIHDFLKTVFPVSCSETKWALKNHSRWEGELRHQTKDGRHVTVSSRLQRIDGNGGTVRVLEINRDITERKRAELDLQDRHREQEHTLRLLLETAAQGILSVDARGLIVMANAATEVMFGWATGELIGRSVEELVPTAFRNPHATHRTAYFEAPQPRPITLDVIGQRKDGSTFPIEISLNHVTTAGGGRAIAFITDISARKQAEEALRRSHAELERRTLQLRRLASDLILAEQHTREELARTLHDGLQQLLFSAGLTLDRAVNGASKPSQVGLILRARADINEAMETARTLSVNLFPPMLHIVGLHAALTWLAKRTQEQYKVVVNVTADPQANPEAGDVRILLFQAVRELLFNAVKHAHADRIDVTLEVGPGDTIHIDVSDEGVGFDPVVTLHHKNQHVGLGLFSIQERLAFIGGHLDIQSAPGKGARFSLTLPRSDLPRLATGAAKAGRHDPGWQERLVYDSADGRSKPLRILIADDHEVARAGLRELLSEEPALQVVGEAANGVEAISQAMALQPDVIVMDVSMPQMNGIETTRGIYEALPHIRIVGLSTHDDENSRRSMREAGAEAYFTKNEAAERLLNYLLSVQTQAKRAAKS